MRAGFAVGCVQPSGRTRLPRSPGHSCGVGPSDPKPECSTLRSSPLSQRRHWQADRCASKSDSERYRTAGGELEDMEETDGRLSTDVDHDGLEELINFGLSV
jgi:hypothetical protein